MRDKTNGRLRMVNHPGTDLPFLHRVAGWVQAARMSDLPHILERTVHIKAPRDTVFRCFTDSSRWAAWWGAGSTIEAHPGGKVWIRFPNGVEVSGEVVEVSAPERIIFTYGFESGKPIPSGASRVVLRLEAVPTGTQ